MRLAISGRAKANLTDRRGSNSILPVNLENYNAFCAGLAHTSHVVQWGEAHVWKVGRTQKNAGKVFAIAGWSDGGELGVTFKVSPFSFDLLSGQPGLRPAPYLASRGMKWIQRFASASMDDEALRDYLRESYRIVGSGLPKKKRVELGLAT